nr:uroporphyrinogen decarboxylase [Nocardiopsis kunsanensis]
MTLQDSPFLRACRRLPVSRTPVWFMRQAGRSLPEYRRVRADVPMLEACARPDMITEITMQPVRRYGVDAAIFFSDIVVPLKAIGIDLDIKPGVGPVVAEPIRDADGIKRLREIEPDDIPFIREAVGQLTGELGNTPLIGFAGAPFTLASYLIEGGPSKNHEHTKALMYGEPELWDEIMRRLASITVGFLRTQIEAGASAVQLFDSWVGALSAEDYRASVMPYSSWIFNQLSEYGIPRIHFGVGTGELLGMLGEAGADVVGADWRVPVDQAAERLGPGKAVQGNLDPATVFAPWEVVAERTRDILARGRSAEGHIFNLGHGVLPNTDPDQLQRLTEFVHEQSAT